MIKMEVLIPRRTINQEEARVLCRIVESQLQDAGYYPNRITIKKNGGKNVR